MIHVFWDELFKYVDEKKEKGDMLAVQIAREIEDILQTAYDMSQTAKLHFKPEPQNEFEKAVMKIKGIKSYLDPTDGTVFFELDGFNFGTCFEVLKHCLTNLKTAQISLLKANTKNKKLEIENQRLKRQMKEAIEQIKILKAKDKLTNDLEEGEEP